MEPPPIDLFTNYGHQYTKTKVSLSYSDFQTIAEYKTHGIEIYSEGLYWQTIAFSPLVGLLEKSRLNPNVILCQPNEFATFCFSDRLIKKGEKLTAIFNVTCNDACSFYKRVNQLKNSCELTNNVMFNMDEITPIKLEIDINKNKIYRNPMREILEI